MATRPEDVLELTEPVEIEQPGEGGDAHEPVLDGDDEVVFSDEAAGQDPEPTELVKHLRQQLRERDKRLAQVAKTPVQQEAPIEVGPRPTMEACEYDQDKFDAALDEWDAKRETKRRQEQQAEQAKRQQEQSWQQVQSAYATKKAALRYSDKDDAERAAFEALSPTQQAVIAKVAPDPALLIYALGKNATKLDAVAAIDDPLVLAATIGRIGATLQVKKRAAPPEVDTPVRGGTVRQQTGDKVAEKLLKAGDTDAYFKHMRDQRKAQRGGK